LSKLTIEQLPLAGKRVFVRADLNAPLGGGTVADDTRLRAVIPTLRLALDRGAAVVLASHLGRPKGGPDPKLSLEPVAERLGELLARPVPLAPDCVGEATRAQAQAVKAGELLLLENLRFHPEEEKNDDGFARQLAELADCYVNDAFAAAHRAHASIEAITHHLQPAAAGLLMQQELSALGRILEAPERPLVAVLGGAKVSDKVTLVEHLVGKVDALVIGGGMAFTFLRALGHAVGRSLVEPDRIETARSALEQARRRGVQLALPVDAVVADGLDSSSGRAVGIRQIPDDQMGLDIGPRTIEQFTAVLAKATDGRLREAALRRGHGGHRARGGGGGGLQRHRRWRYDRRRQRRRGQRQDRLHLDRRRRLPRIPRGTNAPRRGRSHGGRVMRTPLVIGNWKMFGTLAEARPLASGVRDGLKRFKGVDVVMCPPFTALAAVGEIVQGTAIGLGAQNCHWEASGAHTGEIAPPMLVELGCRVVLIGHSERRREMGETDELVNKKIVGALAHGLVPVLCVGETAEERRQGLTFTTVEGQLRASLAGLDTAAVARLVVAYEPVWAIGTGVNATPQQAAEVHGYVRGLVSELASKEVAQGLRVLYGGSVKADNVDALLAEGEIDGALVGGASLNAQGFVSIVKKAARGAATRGE